jgi:crotonobetainyl-CoA:carnitine CoA-transferase CaiB-like acyl-CoA transferase
LAISVRDDAQWRALCALDRIGPDLADRRFADVAGRRDGHNELDALLAAVCTGATSGELVGELRGAGIPAAIVESGVGAVKHRQLVARDRVFTVTHPVVGTASYVGLPMRFSNALAAGLPRPAPLLGQDNADVLAALGYDSAQIDRMARDRVIGWSPG